MSIQTNKLTIAQRVYNTAFEEHPELCFKGAILTGENGSYMKYKPNQEFGKEGELQHRWSWVCREEMLMYLGSVANDVAFGTGDKWWCMMQTIALEVQGMIDAELTARWMRGDRGFEWVDGGFPPLSPPPTPEHAALRIDNIVAGMVDEYPFKMWLARFQRENAYNETHEAGCRCKKDECICEFDPEFKAENDCGCGCKYDYEYDYRKKMEFLGDKMMMQNFSFGTFSEDEFDELYRIVCQALK